MDMGSCEPSVVKTNKLSAHKETPKKNPRKVGKSILAALKSDLLQFRYRPVPRAAKLTDRERVQSALRKFRRLRKSHPDQSAFETLKLMKKIYPSFVVKNDKEGSVPGVEVGDCVSSRAELCVVGLHQPPQAGIHWIEFLRKDGYTTIKAVSIVVSGGYEDDQDDGETLIYTGEGGQDRSKRQCENQKRVGGNDALCNCKNLQNSVRVIRVRKDKRSPTGKRFSYDGLYKVLDWTKEKGKSGYDVLRFKLVREAGQKPLIWPPPTGESCPSSATTEKVLHEEQGKKAQSIALKASLDRAKKLAPEKGKGDTQSRNGLGEKPVDNDGYSRGRGSEKPVDEDEFRGGFDEDTHVSATRSGSSFGDQKTTPGYRPGDKVPNNVERTRKLIIQGREASTQRRKTQSKGGGEHACGKRANSADGL